MYGYPSPTLRIVTLVKVLNLICLSQISYKTATTLYIYNRIKWRLDKVKDKVGNRESSNTETNYMKNPVLLGKRRGGGLGGRDCFGNK